MAFGKVWALWENKGVQQIYFVQKEQESQFSQMCLYFSSWIPVKACLGSSVLSQRLVFNPVPKT